MRRMITMLGTSAATVLVFAAFAAASASALEWQNNGAAIQAGAEVPATIKGTLTLKDTEGGIFGGSVTVQCEGTGEGTVGPGASGIVMSATSTTCTTTEGTCATTPTANAVNTNWLTTLVEGGGAVRNNIRKHAGGEDPGWKVNCSFGISDTCTSNEGSALMGALAGPVVTATFDAASGVANCTRAPNPGTGTVRGTVNIEAKNPGDSLSIKSP